MWGMQNSLGFLGIELKEARNAANKGVISAEARGVLVRVIRTGEECIRMPMCYRHGKLSIIEPIAAGPRYNAAMKRT